MARRQCRGTAPLPCVSVDANGCSVTATRSLTVSGLSIGDLVWNDLNQDGLRDAGELGLSGVGLPAFPHDEYSYR